ncbi:MAG: peptidoglycan bridge formation glycyltransferase FemA/FemB family protein [Bacilli bacterium]|nr:peptidoglycan bridge formation glycyltransferase FemA/FemB family protein [Bacilli bacterium]
MKFQEITEKEYHEFWENHPLKTFLSSIEISKLREKSGWLTYYVGVKENNKLIAATMLLAHKRHFNKYEFYSPRGYLLDFNNEELVSFFTRELKKYIKEKKGYIFRVDPYVIYKERDIDGNIVENGKDNSKIVSNLQKLGFIKSKTKEQVGWMFSLDIENKTEEELLKEMRQNTRNTIKKAEKIGIDVEEVDYDNLNIFYKILKDTGERRDFHVRDISYYQEMYKLFSPKNEVKFFVTKLDLKKYIERINNEKKEKEERLEKLEDNRFNEGKIKSLKEDINTFERRIKEAEDIIEKEKKDTIYLSGSMFILIQPEIVYLSSGNYEEYMKFNSQYLIQWKLIKYGLENGFKKHNFYGIPENINEHPKDYGIYEFKKGFNGYVEELIGEYELPITWHYKLFKLIHKIKGEK